MTDPMLSRLQPWDVILDVPIEPDDTCGDICEDPACHTPHVSK